MAPPPVVAVVDLGSNSARLVIFRSTPMGHVETVLDAQAALKLFRHITTDGRLDDAGIDAAADVLLQFRALSESATEVVAVATAAVRAAANADDVVRALRDRTGIGVRVIDGSEEARLACLGAVHALPVSSGIVADIGGGSMELAEFDEQGPHSTGTFPLGSLRVSDRFLRSDPPSRSELASIPEHVHDLLVDACVVLGHGGELVATGGTARALARIHRANYPHVLERIHGYQFSADDLDTLIGRLADVPAVQRQSIGGVGNRADSIVGGAAVLRAVMEEIGAERVTVAGSGLREGIALERLGVTVMDANRVRQAAIDAVVRRLGGDGRRGEAARSAVALQLIDALRPGTPPPVREALAHAATLCEVGRGVDARNTYTESAHIVLAADLWGFGHACIARLAGMLEKAGAPRATLGHYRGTFSRDEIQAIEDAGAVLAAAAEIATWMPDRADPSVRIGVSSSRVTVTTELIGACSPALAARRIKARFDRDLVVADPSGATALVPVELR